MTTVNYAIILPEVPSGLDSPCLQSIEGLLQVEGHFAALLLIGEIYPVEPVSVAVGHRLAVPNETAQ